MRLTLARVLLVMLAALTLFGLLHERLFSEAIFTEQGTVRLAAYLGGAAAVFSVVVWRWQQQVLRVAIVTALIWTIWWVGPIGTAAVLFFAGSCYGLGRLLRIEDDLLAVVAGAAVWATVLWGALHFQVNFPWVYGVAFAVPYVFVRPPWRIPRIADRKQAIGAAVLAIVLGAQLLAALKPEVSSDGLGMHLVLPASVAQHGSWSFDHREHAWALMPAGADALFTGVYLLGGEAAPKLLNFAFLCWIAAILVREGRGYAGPVRGWIGAALFASTPLVLLVTGSLFVENVWAALLLGAAVATLRREFGVAGLLAGVAVGVKLIAAAFVAPLMLLVLVTGGSERWRAVALAATLAAPPYVFAYVRSGNPVFPFVNAMFQSPDYESDKNFSDRRFEGLRLTAKTPYEITFASQKYIEGQGGAAGFQWLWLFVPGLIAARRRELRLIAGVAGVGAVIVLVGAPNLRYLYGAMPLASLVIACAPFAVLLGVGLALNLWFFAAAGPYDREFALFHKQEIRSYLEAHGPSVLLIDRLNREARGEPVAFFSDGSIAGVEGRAYTDTWHQEAYWKRVREAETPAAIAAYLRELGIGRVVAPTNRRALFDVVQRFQELWLDPEPDGTVGALALYRLRDQEREIPKDARPLGPGTYDDRESRIEYTGAWFHDNQFAEPLNGTLSYSDSDGASLRFAFEGRAVTLVFTRAGNRGTAEVLLDGSVVREIPMKSSDVQWRSEQSISVPQGGHAMELRVKPGGYVDLDGVRIQ